VTYFFNKLICKFKELIINIYNQWKPVKGFFGEYCRRQAK